MAHAGASNTHTNTRVDEKPHMCCTHVKNKKQEIPGGEKTIVEWYSNCPTDLDMDLNLSITLRRQRWKIIFHLECLTKQVLKPEDESEKSVFGLECMLNVSECVWSFCTAGDPGGDMNIP